MNCWTTEAISTYAKASMKARQISLDPRVVVQRSNPRLNLRRITETFRKNIRGMPVYDAK